MRTIQRTKAVYEIARWFLDQFEKDWNINGKPGYLVELKYEVTRRIFAQHWLRAKTIAVVSHDRFLLVDDGAWFNRLDVKQGETPQIARVHD